ncbi:MAG: metallophosphoesterase family protein [Candidatus Saliniplasma sp.]
MKGMKILLISDIHGNYEALKKVIEKEDCSKIYCMGDIVDYGPSPQECVDMIRKEADVVVRGNHDNAVAFNMDCGCGYELKDLSQEVREITIKDLDEESLEYLGQLPTEVENGDHFITHASKGDLFKYLKPNTDEKEFSVFDEVEQYLIFLGHTHIQMDREVDGKRFVNPGSLGQPRDGDNRAAYAVLEDRDIRFERMSYDIETVVEKMVEKDYPERAVKILREGRVVD